MGDGGVFMYVKGSKVQPVITAYKEVAVELHDWWQSTSDEEHMKVFNTMSFIDAFTKYTLNEIVAKLVEYKDSILQIGDEIFFNDVPNKTFIYLGDWIGNMVFKDVDSGEILMNCSETIDATLTGRKFKLTLDGVSRG